MKTTTGKDGKEYELLSEMCPCCGSGPHERLGRRIMHVTQADHDRWQSCKEMGANVTGVGVCITICLSFLCMLGTLPLIKFFSFTGEDVFQMVPRFIIANITGFGISILAGILVSIFKRQQRKQKYPALEEFVGLSSNKYIVLPPE